ncbi:hypothetical protein QN239_31185 [Mycolicibacterium sp. Y3]
MSTTLPSAHQGFLPLRRAVACGVLVLAAATGSACESWTAAAPTGASVTAASSAAAAPQTATATQVVNVAAVVDGQPANGYRDTTPADANNTVSMCDASPSGADAGIYRCSPSAAGADVCWRSTGSTLLCVDDPWRKELHRATVTDVLPEAVPLSSPRPFALLLDDGTQCRIRNGGAWGGRHDGLVGAYGCQGADAVLVATADGAQPIDRSQPRWTVQVGPLGADNVSFPPPRTRGVTTAWFATTGNSHV